MRSAWICVALFRKPSTPRTINPSNHQPLDLNAYPPVVAVLRLRVPARLDTPRLSLRRWEVADAPRLKEALDANADHLRGRIPRAVAEPAPLEAIVARIRGYQRSFASGAEWIFAILSRDEARLIGGAGLYPRIGPGAIELGYWAQAHETGQGYVTEAAWALTVTAFTSPEIERVEIRCDATNLPSAAVAKRLGYAPAASVSADMLVWELSRASFMSRGA
jgi:RimJ/RimL family protein N-acetyltransferase